MFETTRNNRPVHLAHYLAACSAAVLLAGCGGGGTSSNGCTTLDPSRDPSLPGCAAPVTPVTPPVTPVALPTLVLSLKGADGNATTKVSPDANATLQALVKDASGKILPGVLLSVTSSDKGAVFTPGAASALTDANGVATITVAPGSQSGAFVLTASATVNGTALTATTNYSVEFPALTMSAMGISPASLSASGTAGLAVTVLNGTAYAPVLSVAFSSPCSIAGKATISSPVNTVNGVASTSYIDKGCGAADVITASTLFHGNTISQTGTVTVQAASAGQIAFVSALPQNIALKGTGGAGRQETSLVSFKVLDRNGNPVSGQLVDFSLNSNAGGLVINPIQATTGTDGSVSTTVAAGTVNTPVRITAVLRGTSLTTQSDQLVVSTGLGEQNSFTLSSATFNTEGGDFAGCAAPVGSLITARLGDHFHNPVPDGTAVSFTAEGGTIDASCLTGLDNTTLTDGTVITQKGTPGSCSVRFCAGNPKPADGRVTIMAYALGEESFVDANGNNRFDAGEQYTELGEPFRNDRAITSANANYIDDAYSVGNMVRVGNEMYIDSNGNGHWDQAGDGQYNGVLRAQTSVNSSPVNTVHIRQSLVQVLSLSTANITPLDAVPVALDQCVNGAVFENKPRTLRLAIRDTNGTLFPINSANATGLPDLPGNPLPAGTVITFTTTNGTIISGSSFTVPNTSNPSAAGWIYPVQMISDVTQVGTVCQPNTVRNGLLSVSVRTPSGIVTNASYAVSD